MRSMAFFSVSRLQAKDSRMCPGAPKAEPGTTATSPSVSSTSAKSVSDAQPIDAMACETSANA